MTPRALLLAAALLAAPLAAPAQSPVPSGGPPVEIVARDGIEWDRENMRYIARGAARVTQGDKTIEAEDRKSTRLNSSHSQQSRMPSSA